MTEDDLASIAAQLVARVRDDDPEANGRWLASVLPDPADWFRLAFVLAAAVPVDVPWSHLTGWARVVDYDPAGDGRPDTPDRVAQRQRDLLDALEGTVGSTRRGKAA